LRTICGERTARRLGRAAISSSSAVHQDVEAAVALDDAAHGLRRALLVGDVGRHPHVARTQLGGGALGHIAVEIENRQARALIRQAPRDARADAPRAPGDDGHSVG